MQKQAHKHTTPSQFLLTKWIFSAFLFRNRVIMLSLRSPLWYNSHTLNLFSRRVGVETNTVDYSSQNVKIKSWHWGLVKVTDSQRVTRTAFAILSMFSVEWFFFQSATSTNVEGRLIRNLFGRRHTIKWQSSRSVERLQEVVTNRANRHDKTWVDWYGMISGAKF